MTRQTSRSLNRAKVAAALPAIGGQGALGSDLHGTGTNGLRALARATRGDQEHDTVPID